MWYRPIFFILISLGWTQVLPSSAEKAVELLDQVREAQAYWEAMKQDGANNFFKRPAHQWFTKRWKSEVTAHQQALATAEGQLIELLANFSEDRQNLSYDNVTRLYRKMSFVITRHGVPSHFNRRWLSYATLGILTAGVAFYLNRFGQLHALFIIPPQNEQLSSVLNDRRPFFGHDYVVEKDGTQYLQVKKEQEEDATKLLSQRNVSYLKSTPRYSLCWYNEQGEHKMWEFIRKHGIEPVKEIYQILRNEKQLDFGGVLTTDIKFDQEEFEKQLILVLEKAETIEQTAPTMLATLNGRTVKSLHAKERRNAFTTLFFSLGESVPRALHEGIKDIHSNFSDLENKLQVLVPPLPPPPTKKIPYFGYGVSDAVNQATDHVNEILPDIREIVPQARHLVNEISIISEQTKNFIHSTNKLTAANGNFAALIMQILIVNGLELRLKGAALGQLIHDYSENMRLNVELSAMIPLMIASYLTYVSVRGTYRHILSENIAKPLKMDLISLQLLLNKERYTKDVKTASLRFKGEYFYWFQRLQRYKDALPSEYRATYRRFLDDLENRTLSPEQKMTIISALLTQLDQLFVE